MEDPRVSQKSQSTTMNLARAEPLPLHPSVFAIIKGVSKGEARGRWCSALSHAVLVSLPARLPYTPRRPRS